NDGGDRFLTPVVQSLHGPKKTTHELYRMLRRISPDKIPLKEVRQAFDAALSFKARSQDQQRDIYDKEKMDSDGISVVLLGRPYTILSPAMNKGIIDIFAAKGIKTFFQDMLSYAQDDIAEIKPLLDELHWHYAAEILKAAEVTAMTKGVYPVLITSFHCAPDSFVIDYFKQIMNSHEKPYLILQLDEHDSNVGYETRIEAAIRAFRNHSGTAQDIKPVVCPPVIPAKSLGDKTIIFPKWDYSSCPLLVASLKREGLDVRLLEESETSILKSLKYNTGQCIPLSILAQEFIDYMETYNLDPARCVMWMGKAEIACNLKMIPHCIKGVLNAYGNGMEKAEVYHADFSMMDISLRATLNGYLAFMFGGMLRRISCKIRPYEIEKGTTDRVVDESIRMLSKAFEGGFSKERAIIEVVEKFQNITVRAEPRPKVAIFGDLYVRDNDLSNQGLVNFIEENGGEVITTPYSDYMKMIADPYFRKWMLEGKYLYTIISKSVLKTLLRLEKRYYSHFQRILMEPEHVYTDNAEEILARFHMVSEHTGESMDNILKTHYIKKYYPDVALFIQTSPAFCCPSLVTEAMSKEIENYTGVPVVSITYDGTCSSKNQAIIPYLKYPKSKQ
ncbi:MAG: CoA activase, partial [Deltaproteobacteria bacterium]|nr:CoA activase [Deltaproteobacteria bacterium]